jgi:hypothetical protein
VTICVGPAPGPTLPPRSSWVDIADRKVPGLLEQALIQQMSKTFDGS